MSTFRHMSTGRVHSRVKALLLIVTLGLVGDAAARTLPLSSSMRIDVAPDWENRVERTAPAGSLFGDVVIVRHPDGVGVLRLQTYEAPTDISEEALRRLTNVPETELLQTGQWGSFSGYRHDYVENERFHRTWWLANGGHAVFITYECDVGKQHAEIDQIEEVVQSLTLTSR